MKSAIYKFIPLVKITIIVNCIIVLVKGRYLNNYLFNLLCQISIELNNVVVCVCIRDRAKLFFGAYGQIN